MPIEKTNNKTNKTPHKILNQSVCQNAGKITNEI